MYVCMHACMCKIEILAYQERVSLHAYMYKYVYMYIYTHTYMRRRINTKNVLDSKMRVCNVCMYTCAYMREMYVRMYVYNILGA